MKFLFKITLGLIIGMTLVTACNDDDDDKGVASFSLDKEDITLGADGGIDALIVTSEDEWTASATEPWVSVSPANGVGTTTCQVLVDSTMNDGVRQAEVLFRSKTQGVRTVSVHQLGYGKIIALDKNAMEIDASAELEKRYFETKVTTNIPFDIRLEYADATQSGWVVLPTKDWNPEFDRAYRPRTTKVRINWNMNPDPERRVVNVHFVPRNAEDVMETPAILTVTQKAAPKIEDNRAGDSLALLIIKERLKCTISWDPSENLRNWEGVVLWERTDKDKPSDEAVGRIREVSFVMINTKESIPQEVRHLKYLETLKFFSNENTMLRSIDLGSEVCQLMHLKHLQIGAYGLVSLPEDFAVLGERGLETLDLTANNFTNVPNIINKQNFPKLKRLIFSGNRRWTLSDLRRAHEFDSKDGLGFHIQLAQDNTIKNLFLWDTLEELTLSYNYIEGQLPDFKIGVDGVEGYTEDDFSSAAAVDTFRYAITSRIPKILPKAKKLAINLNFLTGTLPDWILYHPHFLDWNPEIFIINQMENGLNSEGKVVQFDNAPATFDYYYDTYPGTREKYEFKDEKTE